MKNHILGEISWVGFNPKLSVTDNRFVSDVFKISVERKSTLLYDGKSIFYNEETRVFCTMLGYINNISEIRSAYPVDEMSDVEIIEYLYSLMKLELISELDGLFLIVIYDEKSRTGYILQSQFTFNMPIYYAYTEDGFVFSTSLRLILKHFPYGRELNVAAVHDFLFCTNMIHQVSIVPNETTFIKKIQKLVPGKYIQIDGEKRSIKRLAMRLKTEKICLQTAEERLVDSIRVNVGNLFAQVKTKTISTTLTGGWDSSTVLFFLRKFTDHVIDVVTIHGGEGYNEIPITERILKNYDNIRRITGSVPKNLGSLPDVTWRFEGYLFEEGMFLRYELCKLLASEDIESIFMGTLADQILRSVRTKTTSSIFKLRKIFEKYAAVVVLYRSIRRTAKNLIPGNIKVERPSPLDVSLRAKLPLSPSGVVYDVELDYVLKMHGIILNSFGILGLYPFINKKTAEMSKSLGKLNRKKRFYKEKIKEVLPATITSYHPVKGPTTSARYLFDEDRTSLMKVFDSGFVDRLLPKKWIDQILRNPENYYLLILQLVYVYLFDRLFVSGKYDSEFENENLNIPLNDFL